MQVCSRSQCRHSRSSDDFMESRLKGYLLENFRWKLLEIVVIKNRLLEAAHIIFVINLD